MKTVLLRQDDNMQTNTIGILIVDDEPHIREDLMSYNWSDMNARIVGIAENGFQALTLCASLCPHLVLCDIRMPLMDGLQFLEALQKMHSPVLVAFLTGYRDYNYAKRAVNLGAFDYIEKMEMDEERMAILLRNVRERLTALHLNQDNRSFQTTDTPVNGSIRPEIERAVQIIRNRYSDGLNQRQVADEIGLSASYFSSLFHQETGKTFNDYLNTVRMENALRLLSVTNLKIYEIAEKVGLSNYRYFSELFKNTFGASPASMRIRRNPDEQPYG